MNRRLLIAFIPPKDITNNLSKIRNIAGIKVKKSSGLNTSHITIIDNTFSDINKLDKELKKFMNENKSFLVDVRGFDTFAVKKSVGINRYRKQNSLIYLIDKNARMNKFRKTLSEKVDYLKTQKRINQWVKENPNLSEKSLENINKYGTPFGLKEWKFHTTVGMIPKDKVKEIMKNIDKLDIKKKFEINSVGIFVRKNGWKLYKKYNFKK